MAYLVCEAMMKIFQKHDSLATINDAQWNTDNNDGQPIMTVHG